MAEPGDTSSVFDRVLNARQSGAEPTDFELILLEAFFAISAQDEAHAARDAPSSPPGASATTPLELPARIGYDTRSLPIAATSTRLTDKSIPIQLLKCPLRVLVAFIKKHRLPKELVSTIRAARRRKTNRKFQRVTRNRRQGKLDSNDHVESDDEGEVETLEDGDAVYAELMAAVKDGLL